MRPAQFIKLDGRTPDGGILDQAPLSRVRETKGVMVLGLTDPLVALLDDIFVSLST